MDPQSDYGVQSLGDASKASKARATDHRNADARFNDEDATLLRIQKEISSEL